MKENQKNIILNYLKQNLNVSVKELADLMDVSESTIRRTLSALEHMGLVTRTHGGAAINEEENFFPSFTYRKKQSSFEKKKIAISALSLIQDGNLVFLDGSTSSYFMAEFLDQFPNIRVITNGIDTLNLLSKHDIVSYSTGGVISKTNKAVLIGNYASQMIDNFHADICFFSAQAIDRNGIIYDCFEEENILRKQMMKNSSVNVFLCDNTKIDKTSKYKLCHAKDTDYIISDTDITKIINKDLLPEVIL